MLRHPRLLQACPGAAHVPNSTTAAPAAAAAAAGRWHSQPTEDGLYIVRFRQYKMAADHKQALQAALEGSALAGSWEWLERRNPAAAFPTDFALLRLAAHAAPGGGDVKVRVGGKCLHVLPGAAGRIRRVALHVC